MPNSEPTIHELREAWVLAEQRVADCRESIEREYVRLSHEEEKCARAWLALCKRRIESLNAIREEGNTGLTRLLPGEILEDGIKRIEGQLKWMY